MRARQNILVVAQQKGGDGKSTLSRLIAEYASRLGNRVLIIDTDTQCNMSRRYLVMESDGNETIPPIHPDYAGEGEWNGRSSVADVFNGRAERYGVFTYPTYDPNIDILPSHKTHVREIERVRVEDERDRVTVKLRPFLNSEGMLEAYDLVVIDTPPSRGPLVASAIHAATHMVVPVQMAQLSVEGLVDMIGVWRAENRARSADDPLHLVGVLPNKLLPHAIQQGILESLRQDDAISPFLIPHEIALRTAFAESDHPNARPKSVLDSKNSRAGDEARAACHFILAQMNLVPRTQAKPQPQRAKRVAAKAG